MTKKTCIIVTQCGYSANWFTYGHVQYTSQFHAIRPQGLVTPYLSSKKFDFPYTIDYSLGEVKTFRRQIGCEEPLWSVHFWLIYPYRHDTSIVYFGATFSRVLFYCFYVCFLTLIKIIR